MNPHAVGEMGRLLASSELVSRGVLTAQPDYDVGIDLLTVSGRKMRRVQVKATTSMAETRQAYRFSVRRHRKSKKQHKSENNRFYTTRDIDVFVFVAIDKPSFWIVPAKELNLGAHWFFARLDSKWKDAWHVLM